MRRTRGAAAEQAWNEAMDAYARAHPELAAELRRRLAGELPADFSARAAAYIEQCQQEGATIASRKASQNCLNAFGPLLPELLGGSADLAGSNLTLWSGSKGISRDAASGNYIYYGVREFGMAAIMNGIALHGGFINYGATFLIFMEYARNAVRMAALMRQQSIFVFTHDSIGLGEDGPTHQPVEQLTALRSTPNLQTWRPCDAVESAVAWKAAIERRDGPSCPGVFAPEPAAPAARRRPARRHRPRRLRAAGLRRHARGHPDRHRLGGGAGHGGGGAPGGLPASGYGWSRCPAPRCSSSRMRPTARPCCPAMSSPGWRWRPCTPTTGTSTSGLDGRVVGMTSFGESAPAGELMHHFGFTVDNVVAAVEEVLWALRSYPGSARVATGDQRLWQDRPQRAAGPVRERPGIANCRSWRSTSWPMPAPCCT